MFRASIERGRALAEWSRRHALDRELPPNAFRKSRWVRGCPRSCVHCRMRKLRPTRQQRLADLRIHDWD